MAGNSDDKRPDSDLDDAVEVLERTRVKRPRLYRVLLHNDDFTTQEFVVDILLRFFRKSPSDAARIMLLAHSQGEAVVGVYTKDLAQTRVAASIDYARENGHPLMMTAEPED